MLNVAIVSLTHIRLLKGDGKFQLRKSEALKGMLLPSVIICIQCWDWF